MYDNFQGKKPMVCIKIFQRFMGEEKILLCVFGWQSEAHLLLHIFDLISTFSLFYQKSEDHSQLFVMENRVS